MAVKKFALTVDTELAEAGSRFANTRKSPANEKPDESDAGDQASRLIFPSHARR